MPVRSLKQSSFFDPEFVAPACLTPGTVPWLLARFRSKLFPEWLLSGWRGNQRIGRKSWPALVLVTLWLLRWTEEGMSRLASICRAKTDLGWRAAMGLRCDIEPPSEKTMRDFEKYLARQHPEVGVPRYLLVHEQIIRLCVAEGVMGDEPLWAIDSTYSWCYGAVLDTIRLLGDGVAQLGRSWARATRTHLEEVVRLWQMPRLLAKSTKGSFDVDWRDPDARAEVVDALARDAIRAIEWVRRHMSEARRGFRGRLLRKCRGLMRTLRDDLETDEQGRLVVARRVAQKRLISLTDPQAQHGRKSKTKRFNGFKLHVLGDLVSGLIVSLSMTPGSVHDGAPTHRLVRRAKTLVDDIEQVVGDTAYGGAALRHDVRHSLGVDLLAPPPAIASPKNGTVGKAAFNIDFDLGEAICPKGVRSTHFNWARHAEYDLPAQRFKWPADVCRACPLGQRCVGKRGGGRSVLLHPYEQEVRAHRAAWERDETRKAYRRRAEFERIVNRMVRHGARHTRSWGLKAANTQAHAIAVTCNLKLLAKKLVEREVPQKETRLAA